MEEKERTGLCEVTFGPILVLIGVGVLFLSANIKTSAIADPSDPGPRSIPIILSSGLILSGITMAIQSLMMSRKAKKHDGFLTKKRDCKLVGQGFGLTAFSLLYVYSWAFIGFATATLMFSFVLMKFWKVKALNSGLVSISLVILIHLLFVNLFKVPLPKGAWMPF